MSTSNARQFTVDMSTANSLQFAALVLQHARALRSLRAVWNSRTAWIGAAELAARHARDAHSERDQYAETARQATNSAVDNAARVTALQAAVDSKASWRPPAPEITDPAELDKLAGRSIVVGHRGKFGTGYQLTSWDGFTKAAYWASPYDVDRLTSREVIEREGRVTVVYVPTEVVRDGE